MSGLVAVRCEKMSQICRGRSLGTRRTFLTFWGGRGIFCGRSKTDRTYKGQGWPLSSRTVKRSGAAVTATKWRTLPFPLQ